MKRTGVSVGLCLERIAMWDSGLELRWEEIVPTVGCTGQQPKEDPGKKHGGCICLILLSLLLSSLPSSFPLSLLPSLLLFLPSFLILKNIFDTGSFYLAPHHPGIPYVDKLALNRDPPTPAS